MNEIITFGRGYDLTPGIKVFVKSAKQICDKVTVICSDLSPALTSFLKDNNVTIFEASKISDKYNVDMALSPYTLKVIFFYLYAKHFCESKNVYMCDFTDLYFQKNLFEIITNSKPYVTSENFLIEKCPTNTTWVKLCYNFDIFNLLKKYEILNGGSILGETLGVVSLLKEMCADMTQIISRIGNYPNIDQASLNKVVYFDQLRYNILNNLQIANLANMQSANVNIDSDIIMVNKNASYVIHQYDANKPLEKFLYEQFE